MLSLVFLNGHPLSAERVSGLREWRHPLFPPLLRTEDSRGENVREGEMTSCLVRSLLRGLVLRRARAYCATPHPFGVRKAETQIPLGCQATKDLMLECLPLQNGGDCADRLPR